MGTHVPLVGQPLVHIYCILLIGDLHFQPVPLYTLDEIVVLPYPLAGTYPNSNLVIYTYNMIKNLVFLEVVELMSQVVISLINEVDLPNYTIWKYPVPVLELGMILKVGFKYLDLLLSR